MYPHTLAEITVAVAVLFYETNDTRGAGVSESGPMDRDGDLGTGYWVLGTGLVSD